MSDSPVALAVEGQVATLTIQREKQRNTLDLATLEGLLQHLGELAGDDGVRVVVLTGAGKKAFCAGADLSLITRWPELREAGKNPYTVLLHTLLSYPKPVVARVNGPVMGGGVGVMLACDLAFAADDVVIATPEVHIGLFPFMVMPLLSHHVGPKRAAEMALTGRRIPALEAVTLGLLNRAVPRDDLDAELAVLCDGLRRGGPGAQRLGKEAVAAVLDGPLHQRIDEMSTFFEKGLQSPEFTAGAAAFMQKQPPPWRKE